MERKFPHTKLMNKSWVHIGNHLSKIVQLIPRITVSISLYFSLRGKSHLFFSPNPLTRSLYMLMRAEQHPVLSCWIAFTQQEHVFFAQMGCWPSEINEVGGIHDSCCCFLSVGVSHTWVIPDCVPWPPHNSHLCADPSPPPTHRQHSPRIF